MAKKKYERFQAVDDYETIEKTFYHEALYAYSKMPAPKTLYGITSEGEFNVIFAKK